MSVNFSPMYGDSPTGTRLPINVDASGNVILSASGSLPLAIVPAANFLIATNSAAAAAANTATITASGGLTVYVQGFSITTPVVAAAVSGIATLGGLLITNMNFYVEETVASGLSLFVTFPHALPGAVNGSLFAFLPAITGGAVSEVNIWGFQR